ncbi:helix-turn-helix domain-containing protein [Actinomadura kijaniata]|uniref:AraC-like DNA-binding protein n=1 Tax=Actinomadura namibiensis TaxID=182080 RepID=A0A7W3LPZ1_ACTNM|nr:helix-turn-helix domain-containing protein [Actinomadura namibiensis]MBA8952160.1 AraC-like DNA-binding protein [Actinomadura namibiensis]
MTLDGTALRRVCGEALGAMVTGGLTEVRTRRLGRAVLVSARGRDVTVRRLEPGPDRPPRVVVGLVTRAGAPGELVLSGDGGPRAQRFGGAFGYEALVVPHPEPGMPPPALVRRAVSARRPPGDGLGETGDRLGAMAAPAVGLVRAYLLSRADGGPGGDALGPRLLRHIDDHLTDPGLSPASVAAAHRISLRYLYRVLADVDVTFGAWVRARRLEGAGRDLAAPGAGHVTIAAVAARWGFAGPARFSRVFRDAYGVSPRQWRAGVRPPDGQARPTRSA